MPDAFEAAPPAVTEGARLAPAAAAEWRHVLAGTWLLEAETDGPLDLLLPLSIDDHVAGGGEQFGRLDLAGRTLEGWCFDGAGTMSYFHAPVFHCSAGWTLIVDTVSRYTADIGATDPDCFRFRVPDGRLRAFLVDGPPRRGVEVLLELTGRAPLAPPWAFGVWHNVRGGADAVLAQAERLQAERIPASALWIEDHYDADTNDGDGWPGNYEPGEYPDNTALVRRIHELGLRALTYVNPMLYRDTPACDDAIPRGLVVTAADGSPDWQRFFHPLQGHRGMVDFVADIAVPLDFTNPAAVSWWQEKVRRILVERGWDGFMEDFGEQVPAGVTLHNGAEGEAVHNLYPLLYHGATAPVREAGKPDSVVFARSGWLGSQQYANVHWGGDQLCSWDEATGMPAVIAAGLSAALSGIGIWGLDIVGIVTPDDVPLEESSGDRELWLRWSQLGALTPVMRTHLGFKPEPTPPVDIWHDAELTDAFRRDATFHLRLFPYLYSLAQESCGGGMPVMRPLLLEFPDDPQAWTLQHEFLLGDALLVAPVLERGARSRLVYVPEGRWHEWGTSTVHEGPAWVTVDAPLDRIPVLQREGSVVPLLADTAPQSLCDERFGRGEYDLELHVCPDGDSDRTLHDGTTLSLHDGELHVDGRDRVVLVRCAGMAAGLAHGPELDFDLRPMRHIVRERRAGRPGGPDQVAIYTEREAERHRGLHHEESIAPEPVRPGDAVTVSVRESPGVGLRSLALRWRADGGDPLDDEGTAVVEMEADAGFADRAQTGEVAGAAPAMTGQSVLTATAPVTDSGQRLWRATIPPQGDGTRVRYAFRGTTADGEVWVEDSGPPLEAPDIEVTFVRPPERRFSYAVTERRVPAWLNEAVVYHVLVDRFHPGGSGAFGHDDDTRFLQHAGGTVAGLRQHLDHVVDLGADTLLLSPLTPGEMHVGYDATDLCAVDPRLGTVDDVRALVRDAHAAGLRVLLDTELSMLGYRHPYAVDARRHADSEYRDWFRWHEWPHRPYSWFGGRILVTLDHTNPRVRAALFDAVRWWLDLGLDGFRLDSAAMAPFDFWTELGAVVRDANPDAVTLGEAFGSVEFLGHWRGRLDGLFDYTVAHRLRACYSGGEATPRDVAAAMATMSRLAPEELVSPVFIENHDLARFTHVAGDERLEQALAVLLTLGPPPVLYYGTEVGRHQGPEGHLDPDARLPMPWGDAQDRELFERVRGLLRLRRDHDALRRGVHVPLHADDTTLAFARADAATGARCVVVANSGAQPAAVDVPVDATSATALLGSAAATLKDGRLRAQVGAGETCVWELSPQEA